MSLPFFDLEAEANLVDALVCAWMWDPDDPRIAAAFRSVDSGDFGRDLSRDAFEVLRGWRKQDRPASWPRLTEALEGRGYSAESVRRFRRFAEGGGVPAALPRYAERLRAMRARRDRYRTVTGEAARLLEEVR